MFLLKTYWKNNTLTSDSDWNVWLIEKKERLIHNKSIKEQKDNNKINEDIEIIRESPYSSNNILLNKSCSEYKHLIISFEKVLCKRNNITL
ncbi:unnamed protein product [Rhizophagus irregularis]|nr:unnamed protein product [Rhizophagus irregularis]CAB4404749.1 unnamed protein product [Rhizophagus irregularis]